jgi:hypothetical protein
MFGEGLFFVFGCLLGVRFLSSSINCELTRVCVRRLLVWERSLGFWL